MAIFDTYAVHVHMTMVAHIRRYLVRSFDYDTQVQSQSLISNIRGDCAVGGGGGGPRGVAATGPI